MSQHYGHDLNQVVYIPAVAVIGRLRLGRLTGDPSQLADVERIVAPYASGKKRSLPAKPSGSALSGHLVFAELAELAPERRKTYLALAAQAADLGFDAEGNLKSSMPAHSEMSDAVFMGVPILARVGELSGQGKYYEMAARHLRFMRKLDLRGDGLYRHSPLDEAAWGRGNGFPALGLAMALAHWPQDEPHRPEVLKAFQDHLAALAPHQDASGCWRQVIDHPGSYRELTCTCMITYAMSQGVRNGWLDRAAYDPIIRKAWYALRTRIRPNGELVDVCTGTGKQKNLRAYFDRTAILGRDARGGAMALLVTTEMMRYLPK